LVHQFQGDIYAWIVRGHGVRGYSLVCFRSVMVHRIGPA
jgi:hypothetical protein